MKDDALVSKSVGIGICYKVRLVKKNNVQHDSENYEVFSLMVRHISI